MSSTLTSALLWGTLKPANAASTRTLQCDKRRQS
jgi:hypothetical protein